MDWKHLLAYITGTVDQELLVRNEYLVTENRILRLQIKGRIQLSDGERKTLAEIGKKHTPRSRKVLEQPLGLLQIGRIKSFREPAIDRRE